MGKSARKRKAAASRRQKKTAAPAKSHALSADEIKSRIEAGYNTAKKIAECFANVFRAVHDRQATFQQRIAYLHTLMREWEAGYDSLSRSLRHFPPRKDGAAGVFGENTPFVLWTLSFMVADIINEQFEKAADKNEAAESVIRELRDFPPFDVADVWGGLATDHRLALERLALASAGGAARGEATAVKRRKRSTQRGDGRAKLIAALTRYHEYAADGCLNDEPVGNNKIARLARVSGSTASAFFEEFGGYAAYRQVCADKGKLIASLKLLNQEYSPRILLGRLPLGEGARRDD